MRKRITDQGQTGTTPSELGWLDLERLAEVEITSEDDLHPIESALIAEKGPGWRARRPGAQTIRLHFDAPVNLRRIYLSFREEEQARTQEFALCWRSATDDSRREILRQQFNFSPPATISEIEDYRVDLSEVAALELEIVPDINRGHACASLARLRLA